MKTQVKYIIRSIGLLVIFLCMFPSVSAQQMAENPFVRHLYTADPSAHVWADGRLYVYASQDIAPPQGCDLMDQYHVFSTDDMINWVDHGEILRASQVPWGRPEGGFMWAPDCAYKDGIYYFYFPHPTGSADWNTTWKIGVATSTSPAGGFVVQGYIPGLESLIDPCVFMDDDGQAYLYHGGGGLCKGGKLKDNMMEIDGSMQKMEGLYDYHEAAWVHKRNGIYYLSYSDNNGNGGNRMRYATSNSPLGPWTHRGAYINPTGSETNHGSIVEYKGQWYAFYHNSALSNHPWLRSICVDKLYYNEDGTIQLVKQTGKDVEIAIQNIPGVIEAENFANGGEGMSYHDSDDVNDGGTYRLMSGVDIEICNEGGYNICKIETGEWLKYNVKINSENTYRLEIRLASTSGGSFHIEIDDEDITGKITVPATGGLQKWQSVFISGIRLSAGTHTMRVYMDEGGFNLSNFMFSFDQPAPTGSIIALQNGGMYATLQGTQVICNKKQLPLDDLSKFTVEDAGDGLVALKGGNGQYVAAGTNIYCNRSTINTITKFAWCVMGDNQIVLRSLYNNKIVSSENGTKGMTCNRTEPGGWETFRYTVVGGSSIDENLQEGNAMLLYPNPARSEVSLTLNLPDRNPVAVKILDMQGKAVFSVVKNPEQNGVLSMDIPLNGIPPGLYIIKVQLTGSILAKKLIVVK